MILNISILLLALPLTLAHDRRTNFRTRRMMMMQPPLRRNAAPFVIRVPHPQVGPTNSLFAHTVAWRAKLPQVKSNTDETQRQQQELQPQPLQQEQPQSQQQPLSDPEIQQFQSQDTNGQVVFGFNSPDQMRIETRNPDGTVHGTYSYLDPYGQVIKRQYWDTGSGFHVTSNTYPLNGPVPNGQSGQQAVPYTPEVQAARDLHFQMYQQALSSLLPAHGTQDVHQESKENDTAAEVSNTNQTTVNEEPEPSFELRRLNDSTSAQLSSSSSSTRPPSSSIRPTPSPTTSAKFGEKSKEPTKEVRPVYAAQDRVQEVNDKTSNQHDADDGEPVADTETQNGSIVIENPEYLRISWTTDSRRYRLNLYNGTESSPNTTSKVQIRHDAPNMYNITKFTVRGRPK